MFEELFKKLDFVPHQFFKKGPRVYVIGGQYHGQPAVFKAPIAGDVAFTDRKLHHEAVFLQNITPYLAPYVAKMFDYGEFEGKFWYLVEWVLPGERQSFEGSDFLIKDKFFTQENLLWMVELLSLLRTFSKELPPLLQTELASTFYELSSYRAMLEPLANNFFDQGAVERIKRYLDDSLSIYNTLNRTTVTHHELYGSQILSFGQTLKLTDWENVGWGHPLRDFMTVWVRAFEHPDWQQTFHDEFKKRLGASGEEFETLFGVEKILQNLGNIALFSQTKLPDEVARKEKAIEFFRRAILETVDIE